MGPAADIRPSKRHEPLAQTKAARRGAAVVGEQASGNTVQPREVAGGFGRQISPATPDNGEGLGDDVFSVTQLVGAPARICQQRIEMRLEERGERSALGCPSIGWHGFETPKAISRFLADPRCSPRVRGPCPALGYVPANAGSAAGSGWRSCTRRSSWALAATTMVDRLIATAPMLIGRMIPQGAKRPAATGMASAL